jgi:hypothetical protein
MHKQELLRDAEFEAVTQVRLDAKHRLTLGRLIQGQVTSVMVYRNAHGQLILDPLVSIPAHEAWLFKNRRASTLVHQGLEDARQGRLVTSKEDFSKALRADD